MKGPVLGPPAAQGEEHLWQGILAAGGASGADRGVLSGAVTSMGTSALEYNRDTWAISIFFFQIFRNIFLRN